MRYQQVETTFFIDRLNRFIAHCMKKDGEIIIAHVKNAGRGKEVLIPGARVAIVLAPGPEQKTDYDLIAVKKKGDWFNIGSQLPNQLAINDISDGTTLLPGLTGPSTTYKHEVIYPHSRFDTYLETAAGQKASAEVRGMILENKAIGALPNAPALRGLKHARELTYVVQDDYIAYTLFIVQFEYLYLVTIHEEVQPALADMVRHTQRNGVQILTYNCQVTADGVSVKRAIPLDVAVPFEDPIQQEEGKKVINLGIIGTNWITHQFAQTASSTKKYEPTTVYSGYLEKAQEFGSHYRGDIESATDLKTFFNIAHMNTVYIASPNNLHFGQTKQAILAGRNVIVERPAFSTPKETDEIIHSANEHNVYFFEAARNIYESSFKKIADHLPLKDEITGVDFSYIECSSRYGQVLDGEEPNIFLTRFSGGTLMDLGVYLVYTAVAWFGVPEEVHYLLREISAGVDGLGWGILRYDTFDMSIQPGKIDDSYLPSGIYLDSGTLVMNGVNATEQIEFHDQVHEKIIDLTVAAAENPVEDEAEDFANVIIHSKDAAWGLLYEEWIELARSVNQVTYDLRENGDIKFDADNEEDF